MTVDAPREDSPKTTGARLTVMGQVVGADFTPQVDVHVRLRSSDRPMQALRTGADGRFEFDFGSPPGSQVHVVLVALAASKQTGSAAVRINPVGPSTIDVGTITLRAGLDLAVRLVHDEQPVAGARLFATAISLAAARRSASSWQGKPWSGWGYEAVSDKDGRALLKDIPRGAVRLLAIADGPLRGEAQIRTDLLEQPAVVQLTRARHLRVEVVRAVGGG